MPPLMSEPTPYMSFYTDTILIRNDNWPVKVLFEFSKYDHLIGEITGMCMSKNRPLAGNYRLLGFEILVTKNMSKNYTDTNIVGEKVLISKGSIQAYGKDVEDKGIMDYTHPEVFDEKLFKGRSMQSISDWCYSLMMDIEILENIFLEKNIEINRSFFQNNLFRFNSTNYAIVNYCKNIDSFVVVPTALTDIVLKGEGEGAGPVLYVIPRCFFIDKKGSIDRLKVEMIHKCQYEFNEVLKVTYDKIKKIKNGLEELHEMKLAMGEDYDKLCGI